MKSASAGRTRYLKVFLRIGGLLLARTASSSPCGKACARMKRSKNQRLRMGASRRSWTKRSYCASSFKSLPGSSPSNAGTFPPVMLLSSSRCVSMSSASVSGTWFQGQAQSIRSYPTAQQTRAQPRELLCYFCLSTPGAEQSRPAALGSQRPPDRAESRHRPAVRPFRALHHVSSTCPRQVLRGPGSAQSRRGHYRIGACCRRRHWFSRDGCRQRQAPLNPAPRKSAGSSAKPPSARSAAVQAGGESAACFAGQACGSGPSPRRPQKKKSRPPCGPWPFEETQEERGAVAHKVESARKKKREGRRTFGTLYMWPGTA